MDTHSLEGASRQMHALVRAIAKKGDANEGDLSEALGYIREARLQPNRRVSQRASYQLGYSMLRCVIPEGTKMMVKFPRDSTSWDQFSDNPAADDATETIYYARGIGEILIDIKHDPDAEMSKRATLLLDVINRCGYFPEPGLE